MAWEIGTKSESICIVTKDHTAVRVGSGTLPVLGTPVLIAQMENVCANLAAQYLEEGQTTVGTKVDIQHTAATPIGMSVTTTATLTEVDRRRLVFEVSACDEAEEIAKGRHERFIVDSDKFMAKTQSKQEGSLA